MSINTTSATRQRLDFEDDEAREERLGKLFQDISKSDTPAESMQLPKPQAESKPYAMPESDVLARVRAFLPDFQASTTALMHQASLDPDAVNLENVKKGERAIAMDLGLGVYDAPGAAGAEGGNGLGPIIDSDASGMKQEEDMDSDESGTEDEDQDEEKMEGDRVDDDSSSSDDSDSDDDSSA